MGNQESAFVVSDSVRPETLSERTLSAVADYIKSGEVKRIAVMAGAGISTSAGIPDFRSPKTGLYANLKRLNLPYAEAVFDISYFRQHPEPFYILAKELYPGNFHPTISHVFMALLERKGLLSMLFTQNIDCLERAAGVSSDKICEAHGSFATQRCIECKEEFPQEEMKRIVEEGEVPHCIKDDCDGLVKPDIVFFGEPLPKTFDQTVHEATRAHLVLVVGTSLSVYPFGTLPEIVEQKVPRVLFNLERVGRLGVRPDDVLSLGPCDTGIRKLAEELGWLEELETLWRELVGEEEAEKQIQRATPDAKPMVDEMEMLRESLKVQLNLEDRVSDMPERRGNLAAQLDAEGWANKVKEKQAHADDADDADDHHHDLHSDVLKSKLEPRDQTSAADEAGEGGTQASQGRDSRAGEVESKGNDVLGGEEVTHVKVSKESDVEESSEGAVEQPPAPATTDVK